MGTALLEGLIESREVMPEEISISNPHEEKLERFKNTGVKIFTSNVDAIKESDIIILAVKPWIIPQVVEEIKAHLNKDNANVCSLAAGVSSSQLLDMFGDESPSSISIAIPNTAMSLRKSMTFIVSVKGDSSKTLNLFSKVGKVMEIEERLLPAATSLASCGIAFAMRYIRAASEGGVELGFKAEMAQRIVCQTLAGAIALLNQPGTHPETEIDKVTTPGGFTIKGLNAMEKNGFSTSVIEGLKASFPG